MMCKLLNFDQIIILCTNLILNLSKFIVLLFGLWCRCFGAAAVWWKCGVYFYNRWFGCIFDIDGPRQPSSLDTPLRLQARCQHASCLVQRELAICRRPSLEPAVHRKHCDRSHERRQLDSHRFSIQC